MDPGDPENQAVTVIEFVLAAMCGICVWVAFRSRATAPASDLFLELKPLKAEEAPERPPAAGVGHLPLLMLRLRARARRERVAAALPEVADLLAVCTEAGLNIALALRRVADRTGGVLGAELRRTLDEVDLGTPRSLALQRFAARNQIPDIEALTQTLISAERFGTQISASLTAFASDLRAKHRRRAEEQARRAPIKILFPLVFLILPAFVLLTVAPLLLGTFESLGF